MKGRDSLWRLALVSALWTGSAFVVPRPPSFQTASRSSSNIVLSSQTEDAETVTEKSKAPLLAGAEIIEMTLQEHRPLGCTVEESLAGRHVFIASVTVGGFADKAGIQEGDVIVGLTDIFGKMKDVTLDGVEHIQGLVASRPGNEALDIRIARGTRVQEEHERVLVELCSAPGADEDEVEQCLTDFIRDTYDSDQVADDAAGECVNEDDAECLVDNIYSMWAEDMPEQPKEVKPVETNSEAKQKAKPWSSRSSPSGTFVRDPTTGKMRNIDE